MDETGQIDKGRGGVKGKGKQNRLFLEAMRKSGKGQFTFSDLQVIAEKVHHPLDGFRDFIDGLMESGEILKRHDGSSYIYTFAL